jgi:hypothetical protein
MTPRYKHTPARRKTRYAELFIGRLFIFLRKGGSYIMLIENNTYKIAIARDDTFSLNSADNKPYDFILNPFNMTRGGDYYTALAISIDNGVCLKKFVIIGSDSRGGAYDAAVLENDDLIVLMNTMLFIIDCRTFDLKFHKEIAEFGIYFSIYKFADGYVIYGETDILKLSSEFETEWTYTGYDIFTSIDAEIPFCITGDTICLSDLAGRKYKLDKFGREILDIQPPTPKRTE